MFDIIVFLNPDVFSKFGAVFFLGVKTVNINVQFAFKSISGASNVLTLFFVLYYSSFVNKILIRHLLFKRQEVLDKTNYNAKMICSTKQKESSFISINYIQQTKT